MEIDSLIIALVYLERLLEIGAPTNLYISIKIEDPELMPTVGK